MCTSKFQKLQIGHKMGVLGPFGNMVGGTAVEISSQSLNQEGPSMLGQ